jgi:hypothetical protein
VATAFQNFYNSSTNPVHTFISESVDRGATASEVALHAVTLGSDILGVPLYVAQFALGAPAGSGPPLPLECCGVLSFRADYGSDEEFGTRTRPRASDRGRTYLGPLTTQALGISSDTDPLPIISFQLVNYALLGLSALQGALAAQSFALGVWSRKLAACRPVKDIAMNQEWDTLRKRGDKTASLTWQPI